MNRLVASLSRVISKERLALACVIALLLTLQGWTWFKRYPLISVKRAEFVQIQDLEAEVARLELQWSEKAQERVKVETDLKRAYQRLFEGDPTATAWSTQIECPSEALEYSVQPDKVITHPEHPDTLSILPTVWMVKSPADDPDNLGVLLAFLHDLTTKQSKWIDLVELLITGNELTQTRAEFSLRLWFRKEIKE